MSKLAIVINGKPGAGKDTLCDTVIKHYNARKISSIDPIAAAAGMLGWDGVKTAASRKFLSELKRLSADFNDYPNRWLLEQYGGFLCGGDDILFVHIRERDQIEAFCAGAAGGCATLLISRPGTDGIMGNVSDDNVSGIGYDFHYENKLPLPQAEEDFLRAFEALLKETGHSDILPKETVPCSGS